MLTWLSHGYVVTGHFGLAATVRRRRVCEIAEVGCVQATVLDAITQRRTVVSAGVRLWPRCAKIANLGKSASVCRTKVLLPPVWRCVVREPAVADLMIRQVITIVPDTPVREIAGLMLAHDLGALPVIDAVGCPVGVVTDVDVLAKLEYHAGGDYRPLLAGAGSRARWRKASGMTAADLMTSPAPAVVVGTSLTTALHALAEEARRIYVVDDSGRLAGVLARRDVLHLLLRGDTAIQADIEHSVGVSTEDSHRVTVEVADGVVTLTGTLRLRSDAQSLCRAVHYVPGVMAVRNDLRYDIDDYLITGL